MRIDRSMPSGGIQAYVSNGMSPATMRGVSTAACTKPAIGRTAAT